MSTSIVLFDEKNIIIIITSIILKNDNYLIVKLLY